MNVVIGIMSAVVALMWIGGSVATFVAAWNGRKESGVWIAFTAAAVMVVTAACLAIQAWRCLV